MFLFYPYNSPERWKYYYSHLADIACGKGKSHHELWSEYKPGLLIPSPLFFPKRDQMLAWGLSVTGGLILRRENERICTTLGEDIWYLSE